MFPHLIGPFSVDVQDHTDAASPQIGTLFDQTPDNTGLQLLAGVGGYPATPKRHSRQPHGEFGLWDPPS